MRLPARNLKKKAEAKGDSTMGKELVCIRECEAPGIGHWNVGDVITDPDLVERFKDNPNFRDTKEEK